MVASSNGMRLKPVGVFVKAKIDPPTWFLAGKDDVRSSFALEDVATEFDIQGLELDWVGMCWDANFRREDNRWKPYYFRGSRWERVQDPTLRGVPSKRVSRAADESSPGYGDPSAARDRTGSNATAFLL